MGNQKNAPMGVWGGGVNDSEGQRKKEKSVG